MDDQTKAELKMRCVEVAAQLAMRQQTSDVDVVVKISTELYIHITSGTDGQAKSDKPRTK